MATLVPGEPARMYALMGVARMGATRTGYVSGAAFIRIGNTHVGFGRTSPTVGTLISSFSIQSELDETPDRCMFRLQGWVPPALEDVIITLGSKTSLTRRFAGTILETHQLYAADNPDILQCDVSAVDYTWQLGFCSTVTARYRNQSATTIARDLVATYAAANGFTSRNVAEGLPALDEITYTEEDVPAALTRLARRIGAYWYVDYDKDVHLFFSETGTGVPVDLTPAHASLADVTSAIESSQGLTRVYVEGRGTRILADVPAGDALIPVETADMFAVSVDVFAKAAFQGSEGGAQYLNFSGVVAGGAGALVGPGIGPSSPPTATAITGTGIESGFHDYGITFTTASGESIGSPSTRVTVGSVSDPGAAIAQPENRPSYSPVSASLIPIGDTLKFTYGYSTAPAGSTLAQYLAQCTVTAPYSPTIVTVSNGDPFNPSMSAPVAFLVPNRNDARVTRVLVFMHSALRGTADNCGWFDNVAGSDYFYQFDTNGRGLHANPPTYPPPSTNGTARNRVSLTNIPIGGASVTGRKIYRTVANSAAPFRLLATLADNTTTTYTDSASDSTLGANAPGADTSGLQQPAGQVIAGSTIIPVAGTNAFVSSGWAVIGNGEQVIRYTGTTGAALTGIPASGSGSITAAISYNSTITAAAMLTGIPATGSRSIREPLQSGGELYLVVQVDDTARQAQLASLVDGTGVREEWVQDRRLSIAEARARGQATLQIRPLGPQRITWRSRDTRTAVGKTITVNLPAPTSLSGAFRIQRVTMDNVRPRAEHQPTFRAEAASGRFSFEDWLRRLRVQE